MGYRLDGCWLEKLMGSRLAGVRQLYERRDLQGVFCQIFWRRLVFRFVNVSCLRVALELQSRDSSFQREDISDTGFNQLSDASYNAQLIVCVFRDEEIVVRSVSSGKLLSCESERSRDR